MRYFEHTKLNLNYGLIIAMIINFSIWALLILGGIVFFRWLMR